MLGAFLCMATAVCGITTGWEPGPQGKLQFIIQIEPEAVPSMVEGTPIEFDLPPEHQGITHFRFQIGRGELPRLGHPAPPPTHETIASEPAAAPAFQPGVDLPIKPAGKQPSRPEPRKQPSRPEPGDRQNPVTQPAAEDPLIFDFPPLPKKDDANHASSASADAAPSLLPDDPRTQSIKERKAMFAQPVRGNPSSPTEGSSPTSGERLTTPLVVVSSTAIGLFAALVYLSWIHLGTRRRYRVLLSDYHAAMGNLPGFRPSTNDLLGAG